MSRNSWKIGNAVPYKNIVDFIIKDCKNKYDKKTIDTVITEANNVVKELFFETSELRFPYSMGEIVLYKRKRRFDRRPDGKLIVHQPPDYYKTKQLWAVDEEARKKKMLLYNDRETYYSVRYRMITRGRQYSNKKYLMFRLNLVFAREILRNGDNLMSYDKSERIYKSSRSVEQGA